MDQQRPDLTLKDVELLPEVEEDAVQILNDVTIRAPVDTAGKCDIPTPKTLK
jgi:hypothetical protein